VSSSQFYSVAVVFGFAYAGMMPLYAVLMRENFPLPIIGTVVGAASMASSLGMALGPLAGGMIFDTVWDLRMALYRLRPARARCRRDHAHLQASAAAAGNLDASTHNRESASHGRYTVMAGPDPAISRGTVLEQMAGSSPRGLPFIVQRNGFAIVALK
jgi:hypothetical protein